MSLLSVCSQLPLSCRVRLPVGGYVGTTFATSSGSSGSWLVIHSENIVRTSSLTSLTDVACGSQAGSTFAAASPASQPGQKIRNRNHRP